MLCSAHAKSQNVTSVERARLGSNNCRGQYTVAHGESKVMHARVGQHKTHGSIALTEYVDTVWELACALSAKSLVRSMNKTEWA